MRNDLSAVQIRPAISITGWRAHVFMKRNELALHCEVVSQHGCYTKVAITEANTQTALCENKCANNDNPMYSLISFILQIKIGPKHIERIALNSRQIADFICKTLGFFLFI